MSTTILDYQKAKKLVKEKLKGENLSSFCKTNKINYQQLQNLKADDFHYNTTMKKVLSALGYKVSKVEKLTFFHVKKSK
ncbi:MAG: hypothetical protein J0M08_06810 [Bacteroidetes bacterium]|nr:hypothetical protein [Bacteroidota bacterium]